MGIWHHPQGAIFQTSFEYRIKVVGLRPTPTKEDCSSYPPWILQDAPSEVTCISDWLRAYSKIANASDGASLPPESYADVLSASRDFLQRPSATSQGIGELLWH
ncbi:hypothetical protein TUM4641_05480 [Shewanella morhuae]|nr:hypothetical protein TUM4641_05480 [Shewanella morhuae]